MKRKISIILLALLAAWLEAKPEPRFYLRLEGNLKMPADKIYQEVFGKALLYPELKAGLRLWGGFGLWVGYGRSDQKGRTLELGAAARLREETYSAGLSWRGRIAGAFGYLLEAGYVRLNYRERAMDAEARGNGNGVSAAAGVRFRMLRSISLALIGGYALIREKFGGETVDWGGLQAAAGLEFRF